MILFFLLAACLSTTLMYANMAPEGFERFPNYYFVETGTYGGDGVRFALRAKYPQIYSIEIAEHMVRNAQYVFRPYSNVHIVLGDSGKILGDVIAKLDKPITFWLDGHNGTPDPKGGKNTPLLDELEQIKHHPIKTHTIIIDDMHCCETILFDYMTREQIAAKILEINPDYTIEYVRGGGDGEYPNNIMVARVFDKVE